MEEVYVLRFAVVLGIALPAVGWAGDDKSFFAGPYEVSPYVRPILGGTFFSDGVNSYAAADLGAEVGLRYMQGWKGPNDVVLGGRSRVRGTYTIGTGANGYDVRVGSFFGPWWKFLGLQTGPDVFTNRYTWGTITLDPTVGLSWPLIATIDPGPIAVWGGLEPTAFLSGGRPGVDWSTEPAFGFGDEFAYLAGASVGLGPVSLTATYTHRITAFGTQSGVGLGVGL